MDMGYEVDFYYCGFEKQLDSEHNELFNGKILDFDLSSLHSSDLKETWMRTREILNGCKIGIETGIRKFVEGEESARFNKGLSEYRNIRKIELLKKQVAPEAYKAVIVNYAVYSFYFNLFSSGTIRILDTHDRLTDRYKMYLDEGKVPADWHSLRMKDEKRAIARADIIWAITKREKNHYIEMLNGRDVRVFTVRHLTAYNPIPGEAETKRVVMVGSDNRLNVEGLGWFLNHVWPNMISDHCELIIAGTLCRAEKYLPESKRVIYYGLFDTEDEVYRLGNIFINPMQAGTGLKIKTLEALAHGKTVLSTREGASGLEEFEGESLIITDQPEEWVRILDKLLKKSINNDFQENSGKKVKKVLQENLNRIEDSLSFLK
jgi:glycosyltransferase involved in cell wall biosynthesis